MSRVRRTGGIMTSKTSSLKAVLLIAAGPAALLGWGTAAIAQDKPSIAPATAPAQVPADAKPTTVTVTGRRPVSNKIDRRVYDVKTNPQSDFASLNDVLSRIPSVTIDPKGRIALRGDTQVKILIDGNPANPAVLRTLAASAIDRVEVITNPSAQYSSDGAGGIINIVLKKKRSNGLNGTVNARGDDEGRYNVDASAAWKRGKWTLNLAAGVAQEKERTREDGSQSSTDNVGTETTTGGDISQTIRRQWYANAEVDHQFTPNDTLSLTGRLNTTRAMAKDTERSQTINGAGQTIQKYSTDSFDAQQEYVTEFEGNFEHDGPVDGEKLVLDLTHTNTESPEDTLQLYTLDVPAQSGTRYRQMIQAPESDTVFKLDYERPFKDGAKLTAGLYTEEADNASRRTADNIASILPGLADKTDDFKFIGRTYAGYVTYQKRRGKWTILPGLRVEVQHWQLWLAPGGVDTSRDYTRWLPSLHVNRDLDDNLKLVASYSHRTQKPAMFDLNPSLIYYSKSFAHVGNAALKPQDTDSYEFGYEYEKGPFSSNADVYYRRNENPIVPTREFHGDGFILASSDNASHSAFTGGELTVKGKFTTKWKYSVNLNGFNTEVVGLQGGATVSRTGISYSGNVVFEYMPNASDWFQATFSAKGKTLTLQGYTTGFSRLDMAFKHRINQKWNLSVRGFDLLNTSKQERIFTAANGQSGAITRTDRPGILIGMIYKFGKMN
jgi:outer membrane receptor protein involved in Fe transport